MDTPDSSAGLKPIKQHLVTGGSIFLVVVALIVGVYLIQQKQIFKPKAGGLTSGPETSFSLVSSGQTDSNNKIRVSVFVRSDLEAANLFATKISFPKDLLQVDSIDDSQTFIKNWVQKTFDNQSGIINSTGGVPNPGFQTAIGLGAKMVDIIFSVKGSGSANLNLESDSAIYSNLTNKNIIQSTHGLTLNLDNNLTPTAVPISTTKDVKVLILKYFPLDPSDPTKLDSSITLQPDTLTHMRSWVEEQNNTMIAKMTDGTKYHGYKDLLAKPALSYQVLNNLEFLKAVPSRAINGGYFADYQTMLTTDVNICDLVDNKGVKDVWIWGYQTNDARGNGIGILESNMSMGRVSKAYWQFGSYGDISNDHFKANDLPQCNKTYVVYNLNYHDFRGAADMMHVYGHQVENEMKFADQNMWLSYTSRNSNTYSSQDKVKGCGDVHSPPNLDLSSSGYYASESIVKSDCEDWKPDRVGQSGDVSCHNWIRSGSCSAVSGGEAAINFFVWWFQNVPGLGNNISYSSTKLRNWWEFMGDFDEALTKGKRLTEDAVIYSTPTLTPTPIPLQGDVNGDEVVNLVDMSMLFSRWGTFGLGTRNGDLNNDQIVNSIDYSLLVAILIHNGVISSLDNNGIGPDSIGVGTTNPVKLGIQ